MHQTGRTRTQLVTLQVRPKIHLRDAKANASAGLKNIFDVELTAGEAQVTLSNAIAADWVRASKGRFQDHRAAEFHLLVVQHQPQRAHLPLKHWSYVSKNGHGSANGVEK